MLTLSSVDQSQAYRAFMEAFADYAMDASGTKEEKMMLRMSKNSVDYAASAGAYDEDRLVGFTLIGIDEVEGSLTAYDAGTGIIPDFRGQGLAKKMFDHALPALQDRGVKRFLLEVLQGNEPAIKAYQKSGFDIVREFRCYVGETENLKTLSQVAGIHVHTAEALDFEELVAEADWTPSFENRFSAYAAIPQHVSFIGAYDGSDCVGAIAYCPPLNWLLSLVVKGSHRRRGVGTALLNHLANTVLADNPRLAALNIDGKDSGMQSFFESVGFNPLVDQYEMRREL